MRFKEILESLRSTRQKDFPRKLNKNYTIGFELELHVDDEYQYEFEMSHKEAIESAPYNNEVLLEYLFHKFNFNLSNYSSKGVSDFILSISDNFELRRDVMTPDEYIQKVEDKIINFDGDKEDYVIKLYEFATSTPMDRNTRTDLKVMPLDKIDKNIVSLKKRIYEKLEEVKKHKFISVDEFIYNEYIVPFSTQHTRRTSVDHLTWLRTYFFNMEPFIEKNKDKIISFFQKNFNISEYTRENIDPPNRFEFTDNQFHSLLKVNQIVPDESVNDGVEIVTEVYDDFNKAISDLGNALEFIQNSPYFSTSSQTGLHVNIGTFNNDEVQKIDLFKFLTVLNEDFVLKDFERINSTYAKSQSRSLNNALKSYIDNLKDYDKLRFKLNNSLLSMSQKFDVVNLSKLNDYGYVEFRGMGGNYDTKFQQIKTNIKKYIRAFEIAGDPNAYRNEYIKVLSKILPNQNTEKSLTPLQKVFVDGGIKNIDKFNLSNPSDFLTALREIIVWRNDTEELTEYMKYEPGSQKDLIGRINKSLTSEMYKNFKSSKASIPEADNLKDILDFIEADKYAPKLYKLISMLP